MTSKGDMPTLNLEWPFVHLNLELDAYPWQKQEVFKGVSAFGSLSAGWGFPVWRRGDNRVRYSAAGANQLVASGAIVTNAVFNRDVEAMFQPTISDFDKADILASHIPAVSSPAGKVAALTGYGNINCDVNTEINRPNGWSRGTSDEQRKWLHSDIKNMAYYFLHAFYTTIVNEGGLK